MINRDSDTRQSEKSELVLAYVSENETPHNDNREGKANGLLPHLAPRYHGSNFRHLHVSYEMKIVNPLSKKKRVETPGGHPKLLAACWLHPF